MSLLLCSAFYAALAVPSQTMGDTASVAVRAHERWAAQQMLVGEVYTGPALRPLRYQHSLSELRIGADFSRATASSEPQEGLGWQGIEVQGNALQRLSNGANVWGEALYTSGQRRDVRWNEIADYQRLRPYVVADSLGGHLHSEQYQFHGGTAFALGNWTLGGELGFSALQEYRRIDPRPRNRCGTMQLHLGVARNIGARYALGIDAAAQKYKQRSTISYYNDLGVSPTYHPQGLGLSYARFDGANTSTNYSGHRLDFGLALAPTGVDGGLSASLRSTAERYEKVLLGVNDLTLNELHALHHRAELGWRRTAERSTVGALLWAELATRRGVEMIYGDAANNEYPRLSEAEQYSEQRIQIDVRGLFERCMPIERWCWHVLPGIGYAQNAEQHLSPHNFLNYSNLHFNIATGTSFHLRRALFLFQLQGAYHRNLHSEQMLAHVVNAYAQRVEDERFAMLRANRILLSALLRFAIPVKSTLLNFDFDLMRSIYSNGHSGWRSSFCIGLFV